MTLQTKSPSRAYLFTISVVGVGSDPDDAFTHALDKIDEDFGAATHGPVVWEEMEEGDVAKLWVAHLAHNATKAEA